MGFGKFLKKAFKVVAPVAALAIPGVGGVVGSIASKAIGAASTVDKIRALKGKKPKYSLYAKAAQDILGGPSGEAAAVGQQTPAVQQTIANTTRAGRRVGSGRRRRKAPKSAATRSRTPRAPSRMRAQSARKPRRPTLDADQYDDMATAKRKRTKRKATGAAKNPKPWGPGNPLYDYRVRKRLPV